jgi:superfamily II DNA or RNA helicase
MDKKYVEKLFPFPPRGKQVEIVNKILDAFHAGKKHVVLSLPTGGGKSVIAYAVGKHFGSAYVLTNQKVLQEQYKKDLHVPYILGRSNYICQKDNTLTCEMGICKRVADNYCSDCPYLEDRREMLSSWISDMNYAY